MTAAVAALFVPKPAPLPLAVKSRIYLCAPVCFLKPLQSSPLLPPLRFDAARCPGRLRRCSAVVQDVPVDKEATKEAEASGGGDEDRVNRWKLYVANLPWDYVASDLEKLFRECGAVKDVEIIKQKDGRSRGFAFVTLASEEEARAAVEKLDSFELMGRIIRVEFAKSFRKPQPPPPPPSLVTVEQYKIYVSNLAWKARSVHLREFFSGNFNPLSARVVFENPTGRSAGYGFVAFSTRKEAEAAISELDGKELLGRPVRLRISQSTDALSDSEPEEAEDQSYDT